MKTASEVAAKFVERASAASADYGKGVETTQKDQSARAIAAKAIWKAALDKAAGEDRFAKGLQRSGTAGWKAGVKAKGETNFATGVSVSGAKYAERSAKFDAARASSGSMPRGPKGSAQNLAKVSKVVSELMKAR